jgi:hypothetical protein
MERKQNELSRRSFVKATAYVAPLILTLKARPAHASLGSGHSSGPSQGTPAGVSDKHLRKEVKTFVSDLRSTEHGPISPEVRSRLVSTAGNWDASGADKYIERSVSRAINQLHRSGNERGANRMKNGIAYLTTLWTRLLGL